MKVLKNFEALFLAAFGIAIAANVAYDASVQQAPAPQVAVAKASTMPVVVVSAKRMTPAEKVASLVEEQKHARSVAGL